MQNQFKHECLELEQKVSYPRSGLLLLCPSIDSTHAPFTIRSSTHEGTIRESKECHFLVDREAAVLTLSWLAAIHLPRNHILLFSRLL